MSEGLEATRRTFLRATAAVTVNPLNPDVSELSDLEDALEESGVEKIDPRGNTELTEKDESIALVYRPGEDYYSDAIWMHKDRENIEEGSPWSMLKEFGPGISSEINETFTRSFGSQDAFLSHFFETADNLENGFLCNTTTGFIGLYRGPEGVILESKNSKPDVIRVLDDDYTSTDDSGWDWIHGDQFDVYLDNRKEKAIFFPHQAKAQETIEDTLGLYDEIPDFMDSSLPYAQSVSETLEDDLERDEEVVIKLASLNYQFELY